MTDQPKLDATVENVIIESEYNGKVYEQTVTVSVNDFDSSYDFFTGSGSLDDDLVGKTVPLELSVLPSGRLNTTDGSQHGILECDDPISAWSYLFSGTVECTTLTDEWFVDDYERLLLLDIGVGTVLVQPDDAIKKQLDTGEVSKGDDVEVEAIRTEIVGIGKIYD